MNALAFGQRRIVGPLAAVALHPDGQVHHTVSSKAEARPWR
jgi:hypothetical protein